jgi:alkylation response protein AidB-like acyl-CoA dehydrogenase
MSVSGYGDLMGRVRELAAKLPDRSAEIERLRRLPPDLVDSLRATGVFRMAVPRDRGGLELSPRQMCDVVEVLAAGNAAVGWCAGIGADTGLYAAYLDPAQARAVYPGPDMITAGWIFPAGQAHRVPEGYRISGRWGFGSGITHADRVVCGCVEYADGKPVLVADGRPAWRVAIVRPDQVRVIDTWHTTGLLGTGSHDYAADEVLVPAGHTFTFFRAPRQSGRLYQRVDNFLSKFPGVPLGVGRAALEFSRSFLSAKLETPSMQPAAASRRVQGDLARAEALVGAARAYVHQTLEDDWEAPPADADERRGRAALARQFAFEACREAVGLLYDTAGSAAVYTERTPLDRHLRDLITASQHVTAQVRLREWVGELRLGGQPAFPFL